MATKAFGSVRIFRPSLAVESSIREKAKCHLLAEFQPGEYRGAQANKILQHQFRFYEKLLNPLIPYLAASGGAELLLFQYDEAWRLLHGNGIVDLAERDQWAWVEPRFKRAIKYLLELICLNATSAKPPRNGDVARLVTETALVCAESMVDLAMQSDVVHSVFSDHCVVRIFESGPYDFTVDVEGEFAGYDQSFSDSVIRDRRSRHRFVPTPQFDNQTRTHQRFLDEPFREEFGMSYGEFIGALAAVINDCQPSLHPNALPVLFVNRDRVFEELNKWGRPAAAIERALNGFAITRENLLAERRAIWKPKQQNRAYRRAFFVLPHETGPHLAFSRAMARESLIRLASSVCYRHLPKEWKTAKTDKAVEMLSHEAGSWFEKWVQTQMNGLGFDGCGATNTIGTGLSRITIPDHVGQIDFVGYSLRERLLLVAETKMVMTGLEAAYWRDDLHEFVFGRRSYADRFRRKLKWVSDQRYEICAALGVERAQSVAAAMLTLYPCIAREFIQDFPCVSITEFMLDYERESRWPYPPT